MVNRSCLKLTAKYFNPSKVLAKIGTVAYRLELPLGSKIHSVFHMSRLKKHIGKHTTTSVLPILDGDGLIAKELIVILDRRFTKKRGRATKELLLQWSNCFPEDASWEIFYELLQKFPNFNPWGQGFSQGKGIWYVLIQLGLSNESSFRIHVTTNRYFPLSFWLLMSGPFYVAQILRECTNTSATASPL